MGRQAVEHHGIGASHIKKGLIDLVTLELLYPFLVLCLLAHGSPHIRVQDVGPFSRFHDVFFDSNGSTCQRGIFLGLFQDLRIRVVPLGACTDHVHPHLGAGIHQGMGHVVAITDKDKLAAFEDFLVLHDGK